MLQESQVTAEPSCGLTHTHTHTQHKVPMFSHAYDLLFAFLVGDHLRCKAMTASVMKKLCKFLEKHIQCKVQQKISRNFRNFNKPANDPTVHQHSFVIIIKHVKPQQNLEANSYSTSTQKYCSGPKNKTAKP